MTTNESSKLRSLIDRADQVYYNGGDSARQDVLSDDEYDALKRQLAEIDPSDPRLTRVGAPVGRGDEIYKAEHKIPMGSLDNAMNREELSGWYDGLRGKYEPFEVIVSAKLDGASMSITYSNGIMTQAITRGDGEVGEDVTANAAMMKGVALEAFNPDGTPFNGFIRGEVLLTKENFKKAKKPKGEKDSNPRNLGNGIMRRLDGDECHLLEFRAFRLYDFQGNIPDVRLADMFTRLQAMGFATPFISTAASTKGATWAETNRPTILRTWAAECGVSLDPGEDEDVCRDALDVEIDGLVVSVDSTSLLGAMGINHNRPRGEIALKFPPRAAATILEDVVWELGRTNKLTPVAKLKPVEIGGVIVQNATLCNPEEIARLGIKLGDNVLVTRQGDVIPKVTKVVDTSESNKPIEIPTTCPVSGAPVIRRDIGGGKKSVDIYADVSEESDGVPLAVRIKRLEHWTKTVDIKGFGPKTLEVLSRHYPDRGPSAIYEWAETDHELKGVSPKVQETLRAAVKEKQRLTIPQILGGLGIEKLGVRRIEAIITQFPEVFNDLKNWLGDELEKRAVELSLPNVAAVISDGIKANREELKLLGRWGVRAAKFEPAEAPAEGSYVFCLTGTFEEPKAVIHKAITEAGHAFETAFKSNVTHVVAADPNSGSSKLKKARDKGVGVIGLEEMHELLN